MKKILNHIFIDGLSGMALGLFSTLIIGTIIGQIGTLVGNEIGTYLIAVSSVAKTVTGAGIGVGVAAKFKQGPLVTVSAAVAGMIGAFPALGMESFALGKAGEPLGAFVAALIGIECGRLVAGRTKIDIILTPLVSICTGAAAGFIVGPPISNFMKWLGNLVNINVEASPILGGIAVSVLMGMILTLPISSAALGVSMGLTGLAAGAATIGCCCQMVGFAVASYRENKFGGLVAQGLGTSMLQVPNIMRHPLIWLPVIFSSAILGPVSTILANMQNNATGSGMGSAGLVGQITTYQTMIAYDDPKLVIIKIILLHFVLPAVITLFFSEVFRKANLIKSGDMALNL